LEKITWDEVNFYFPGPINGTYVYFISGAGLIKIGHSENPVKRLAEIQRYSPVALCLVAVIEGGQSLEKELHKDFADGRSHGEWFNLTDDLLAVLRQIDNDVYM